MRAANAELVALVRKHLPMGFYRRDTEWSLRSFALLVRMTDTVEAAMHLMDADHEVDGRTLVRSLYEQVVTFAWLAIDPGPRFSRWFGQGLWDDLHLHNDAMTFGEEVLPPDEVTRTKRLLGLADQADADEDEAPVCTP
jgi:Family of unknown function (DUF5677)